MSWTRDTVEPVLLRRIARALEKANDIAQYRIDREFPPLPVKPGKGERRGIVVTRQTEGPTNATRKDISDILEEIDRNR